MKTEEDVYICGVKGKLVMLCGAIVSWCISRIPIKLDNVYISSLTERNSNLRRMTRKRPRIKRELLGEVIIDDLAYVEIKGSRNARQIGEGASVAVVELWCDKHYYLRLQHGDENGARSGIDEARIKNLVFNVLGNIFYYALKVKNFVFINYDNQLIRTIRIVIQKMFSGGLLNVVLQFYHISENRYEATVITAMVTNTFMLSDGQYIVLLEKDGSSKLNKYDNQRIIEISAYP